MGVDAEIGEDMAHNAEKTDAPQKDCLPQEVELRNYRWAIRRMPTHCVQKCFGMTNNKRCTNIMQSRSPGLIAPCFWGNVATRVVLSNNGCGLVLMMFNIPKK